MGALDPHIHKLNLAELQGEGKLEQEGVRPQTKEPDAANLSTLPAGDQALDLLPAVNLVTSSEDYYPTVAINALMRVLRNPGLAGLHSRTVSALFDIIKSMGFGFVQYLSKARGVCVAGRSMPGVTVPWRRRGGAVGGAWQDTTAGVGAPCTGSWVAVAMTSRGLVPPAALPCKLNPLPTPAPTPCRSCRCCCS